MESGIEMELNQQWQFDVLGVYNYKREDVGNLAQWYNLIKNQLPHTRGCLVEFGINRGRSFLATCLLLRDLGQEGFVDKRTINVGFDSFSGFPEILTEYDQISYFSTLHRNGIISDEHFEMVNKNIEILNVCRNTNLTPSNVSTSGDFSGTTKESVERKIKFLGLSNARLVESEFSKLPLISTLPETSEIAGALLDCDLYESYLDALEFIWPRLSTGGFIYFDEYFSLKFPGARVAVDKFFKDIKTVTWHSAIDNGFERWWLVKK